MLKLRRAIPGLLFTLVPFAFVPGCGVDDSTFDGDGNGASSGASGVVTAPIPTTDGGGGNTDATVPPAVGCGSGLLDQGEVCDDFNTVGGDGCSADCKTIEEGFTCAREGAACNAICGDGKLLGDEECDDGNAQGGDGCSEACQLEAGKQCLVPGQPCTPTVCGNGIKEGLEQCDDGNERPYDGCFACALEPVCNGNGCVGICGDGVIFPGEACDDGNTRSGDGCSATCTLEQGFTCENRAEALPDELVLPVLYRDFKSPYAAKASEARTPLSEPLDLANGGHPDFERFLGAGTVPNLVKDRLGADGRPEFNPATDPCNGTPGPLCQQLTGAAEFYEWYHDGPQNDAGPSRSMPVTRTLTLGRIPGTDVYQFDSDKPPYAPFSFFPIDDAGYGVPTGQRVCRDVFYGGPNPTELIPKLCYGAKYDVTLPGCTVDTQDPPRDPVPTDYDCIGFDNIEHNFSFTTELHFWFTYEVPASDAVAPELSFSGDDDVWIFINGRRVVDLGGLHGIETRSFKLTATAATSLGMTANGVYDIALFHAERRTRASNFKFTLGGFVKAKTFCDPICGDGIKTRTETCDNGDQNLGGYNQCAPNCVWGPRCGDGIIQSEFGETCDDRNFTSNDGCSPLCREDGIIN